MNERVGAVVVRGAPMTLIGPELKPGDRAPEFEAAGTDWKPIGLSDSRGRARVISVVHSLDTPVCDLQTQRFEAAAARFKDVVIYTVSMDLPFAQARYCNTRGITNLKTLSDYKDASFARAYGVLIKELRLTSRAIIVIGKDDIIKYVDYVKDVSQPPNYDKALEALAQVAGAVAKA